MNGNHEQPCPLTEADCQRCIRIIAQTSQQYAAGLERMKRAGFNLEALEKDNEANRESALGIMREYFPTRSPGPIG